MFKRRVDKQDAIHQTNIKRGITSHFARTLKVLQHRHLQTDSEEFIYSDDFSNNLCSALEAVFLHGLKDSVVTKMSSYVGLVNNQDQAQYVNFWNICAKFTHKDVITQLRGLAQINTEIGLCRAWIRVALNDGLMESYLHSMIVDHKLLSYYYHSHSYLRDHEQPGILKNFLTGLMSLSFKLSLNSSVLNTWNNTSLQLAGVLDSQHIPSPAVSAVPTDSSSDGAETKSNKIRSEVDPIVVNKNTKTFSRGREGSTPPMFSTIQDVEKIRRLTQVKVSGAHSVASEGSTSSHISCPDPGISSTQNQNFKEVWERASDSGSVISPALYPRADRDTVYEEGAKVGHDSDTQSVNSLSTSELGSAVQLEENRRDSKSSVIIEDSSPFFDLELAQSSPRPRSRRVTDDDLKSMSPKSATFIPANSSTCHSLSNSPKPSDFAVNVAGAEFGTKEISQGDGDTSHKIAMKDSKPDEQISPKKVAGPRGYEEICATLPPLKLDPLEQEVILKKVLGEIDEQADREREKREEHRANFGFDEPFEDPKPVETSKVNKEKDLAADKQSKNGQDSGTSLGAFGSASTKTNHVKKEIDKIDKKSEKISPAFKRLEIPETDCSSASETNMNKKVVGETETIEIKRDESHFESEERTQQINESGETTAGLSDAIDSSMSGNYGNSLSGMMGWSSEIEMSPKERNNRKLREKTRGESFASMLKTYAGQNSLISTTLDQVIQTFYGADDQGDGSPPSPAGLSAEDENDIERQDSCLEDFEILTAPSNSFNNIQEMDSSRSIFLFRIPREHGLSHQNFTCRGCSRPIGIIYGQPRLCEFDGGLYCYECHENNETYIPSYIVYNWDFSKKKVCTENYKFLLELEDQAFYDLEDLNTKLETHVPELKTLKVLRQQLCFLKSYMFNCTQKVAESLRQKVWPREHLYDRSSVYSVNDFHQVQSGALIRIVKDLVKFASKHVYECSLCSQKGFVCEICRNPQVIFPFELETTIRCSTCKSVYHKTCMTESLPCPKCERWGKRNQNAHKKNEHHPEDYGMSPSF